VEKVRGENKLRFQKFKLAAVSLMVALFLFMSISQVTAAIGSQTSLTLTLSSITLGSSTTCTAHLRHGNIAISGATITFTSNPSTQGTFSSTTQTTDSNGDCHVTFTPNSVGTGQITITATFAGDSSYQSSSASSNLIVGKGVTAITVASSATGDVDKTKGESTTISGFLSCNGKGIGGKIIHISYFDGNNYVWIGDVTTSTDLLTLGQYSFIWSPSQSVPNGPRPIQVKFDGDSDYLTVSNDIGTGLPVHIVPEYMFGGLAAIGACFVGFVTFKKRSSLLQLHLK